MIGTEAREVDAYERIAGAYDFLMEPMNGGLRKVGLRLYRPGPNDRILDVCCGTGVHLDLYRQFGCSLHGIDASPGMIAQAARRLGRRADVQRADATAIPYHDATFDLVQCMLALHEMDPATRVAVVHEIQRVTRPGGRVLLVDFHPGPYPTLKGKLTYAVATIAEFMAGRNHFAHSRQFLASGGLTSLLRGAPLRKVKERLVGGGTLVVTLFEKEE